MMTISKNSKVTGSSYFREVAMKQEKYRTLPLPNRNPTSFKW